MEGSKASILIVDDTAENIDILQGLLKDKYRLKVAKSGEKALEIMAGEQRPDLILLDIMMPEMDGYQVCEKLKEDPRTRDVPVIFLTARVDVADEQKGFELGAVDYITKPISPSVVLARVKTHLALYDQNRLLEQRVMERTRDLHDSRFEIIRRLGRAAEYKDNETGLHVIRMSHYTRLIALASGISDSEAELLLHASPMHDIGKIGIPDKILLKPGKLDNDEWKEMRKHAEYGAQILGDNQDQLIGTAREIALTHHEKWDGTGYPAGLKEEDIPVNGRVVAVADVFDALTTDRPYKKAWGITEAAQLIREESGKHFDPDFVKAFEKALPDILLVKAKYEEK